MRSFEDLYAAPRARAVARGYAVRTSGRVRFARWTTIVGLEAGAVVIVADPRADWPGMALVGIFVLVLAVRWWAFRGLQGMAAFDAAAGRSSFYEGRPCAFVFIVPVGAALPVGLIHGAPLRASLPFAVFGFIALWIPVVVAARNLLMTHVDIDAESIRITRFGRALSIARQDVTCVAVTQAGLRIERSGGTPVVVSPLLLVSPAARFFDLTARPAYLERVRVAMQSPGTSSSRNVQVDGST